MKECGEWPIHVYTTLLLAHMIACVHISMTDKQMRAERVYHQPGSSDSD